jgi:hypothetical protein
MNSEVYVVAWDKVVDNVLSIEEDFKNNGISHTVVSSCTESKDGWMDLTNDAWATKQLHEILSDAVSNNKDYIFILYGDLHPESLKFSEVIKGSLSTLEKNPDCNIYTTEVKYNHWGSEHTIIRDKGDNVFNVCATDLSFVGLSRDAYTFIFNFMQDFFQTESIDNYKSSWGFDILCWIHSMHTGKEIIRDCNLTLLHDISSTGYDSSSAWEERHTTVRKGIDYMVSYLGFNFERIVTLHNMTMQQYYKREFSYDDFYQTR